MSSASVSTTPSKPSSVRSSPSTRALSVAGCSSRQETTTWAVITQRTPAATASAKGARSRARQVGSSTSMTGSARWESVRVAPCPGKCLAQAATPASWSPRTKATTCRPTPAASAPNDRSPITGLSGSDPTSATGPSTRSTPRARAALPRARATRAVVTSSSSAPRVAWAGHGEPVRASRRVTAPPSSSAATSTPRRTPCSAAPRAVTCASSSTFWPKRQTPASPCSSARRNQSGTVVPTKPGSTTPAASRRSPGSAAGPAVGPALTPSPPRRPGPR